ncbi:MAG: hypothetical protein Q9160_000707 [Pyrenula sp. 1 TL-2023]
MSRRGITLLLGTGAAVGGYYLYSAGGDPKVAQKNAEADVSRASAKVKSEVPGKEKEAEKQGQAYASQAGQKIDQAADDARARYRDAEAKGQAYANDAAKKLDESRKATGEKLMSGVDKFDETVTKGAAEAKSGISSWFGFGGKK